MDDLPKKKDLESVGENHGFRMNSRLLVGGLLAIVLVIFIASNSQSTTVQFLSLSRDMPLWLVLTITALIGAAVGAGATHLRARKKLKLARG